VRRPLATLAGAALLLTLTGCGPYAARSFPVGAGEDAVPGTWSQADGATLVFAADGTFGYDDLPAAISDGSSGDDSSCADDLDASADRDGPSYRFDRQDEP
jgi:hypothetical protein